MLKKTVTYTNLNGTRVSEDLYFNFTVAEVVKELATSDEDPSERLKRIGQSGNGKQIMAYFEDLISRSYGVKSEDGRRFIKGVDDPEILRGFFHSEAYSTFFMDLITNPDEAASFVNGIYPADLTEQAKRIAAAEGAIKAKQAELDAQTQRPQPQDRLPKRTEMRDPQTVIDQHRVEPSPVEIPVAAPVLEPAQDDEYQQWLREKAEREQQITHRPPHESQQG